MYVGTYNMPDTKISDLTLGTPKPTDIYVAVDTTDSTMAPTGTDKRYERSDDVDYTISQIVLDGDVIGVVGTTVIDINVVTNEKLEKMPPNTIKGNNTGVFADPIDLTIAQVKTELGFGTMANQNANNVNITGGIINGTVIGGVTPSAITASSITMPSFITAGIVHNNASGVFSSSLIVNADISASAAIVDTKLATISTVGKVANAATTAISTSTPNSIVLRDASNNFSANIITAALNGNASTATSTTNFSGSLAGNVTGTQGATVIAAGVITNAMVNASAAISDTKLATISASGKVANSATTALSSNTSDTIVLRDSSGNFSAGIISASLNGNAATSTSAANFAGSLSGNVTGTQGATVIAPDVITNSMINTFAGIFDTKLATISTAGKVSNSATTATSANTASAIVARDGSGNCSVGTLTASTGIMLPTSGGTPSILDWNGSETIVFQMTGAVTPTFDFTVKFTRIGKTVVMKWIGFDKTCNSTDFLFTADLVPARFRPTYTSGDPNTWIVTIIKGALLTDIIVGAISFGSLGNIQISGIDGSGWISGNQCGIFSSSITYDVD